MGATTEEIEQKTRAAVITKAQYSALFGISRAAASKQAKLGRLDVVEIGGRQFVRTAPLRAALGFSAA